MPHLIVFDLDGTLVDSRLDLAASANALLEGFGARPLAVEQVVAMVGEGARVLVDRVLRAAGVDADLPKALEQFLEIYDDKLVDHTRPYPRVRETLQALDGAAAVTMLTNKPGHHTERLLAALDIRRFFSTVIGGDSTWPRKPDPAGLLHLMDINRASSQTTIMVGDSMVDVETAQHADTQVCVARYGFGRLPGDEAFGPEALIARDPSDLLELLMGFVGGGRSTR
jgi:phosphoglycolate phosphatase